MQPTIVGYNAIQINGHTRWTLHPTIVGMHEQSHGMQSQPPLKSPLSNQSIQSLWHSIWNAVLGVVFGGWLVVCLVEVEIEVEMVIIIII